MYGVNVRVDGNIRVAVLGITAAGIALTLTAASTVYFAELYWTPAALLQAEDRAHRMGQLRDVSVYYFLASGTVDDILWPMIRSKMQVLGEMVEGHQNADLAAAFHRPAAKANKETMDADNGDGKAEVETASAPNEEGTASGPSMDPLMEEVGDEEAGGEEGETTGIQGEWQDHREVIGAWVSNLCGMNSRNCSRARQRGEQAGGGQWQGGKRGDGGGKRVFLIAEESERRTHNWFVLDDGTIDNAIDGRFYCV